MKFQDDVFGQETELVLMQALENAETELQLPSNNISREELELSQVCKEIEAGKELNAAKSDLGISVQDVWDSMKCAIDIIDPVSIPCLEMVYSTVIKSKSTYRDFNL